VFRLAKKEFTMATRPSKFAQTRAAFGSAAALLLALPAVTSASATNAIPTSPRDIARVMKKANTWQLAHPWKPEDRNWIRATWYTGVMAAAIAARQGRDGLWRPNLADPDEFPMPEASGTGFFTYGLAWGVQQDVLDRKAYLPVVEKAWASLVACVSEEGKVEWGQPVGDRPVAVQREDTHEYVTGAFLLAGSQVFTLAANGLIGESATGTRRAGAISHDMPAVAVSLAQTRSQVRISATTLQPTR
jgi:hypothetical protein